MESLRQSHDITNNIGTAIILQLQPNRKKFNRLRKCDRKYPNNVK